MSQDAARHLYAVQGGSNSEGLLVVCGVTVEGRTGVALMKLEEEEGVQVEQSTVSGKPTLSVTVLDNLMLTDNTRVFKAGVFWMSGNRLVGVASDEQQGTPLDIADYFLAQFLGCRLERRPDVLTRAFYDTATRFISEEVSDSDKKLDYERAVHAELCSRTNIDPVQFANGLHVRGCVVRSP